MPQIAVDLTDVVFDHAGRYVVIGVDMRMSRQEMQLVLRQQLHQPAVRRHLPAVAPVLHRRRVHRHADPLALGQIGRILLDPCQLAVADTLVVLLFAVILYVVEHDEVRTAHIESIVGGAEVLAIGMRSIEVVVACKIVVVVADDGIYGYAERRKYLPYTRHQIHSVPDDIAQQNGRLGQRVTLPALLHDLRQSRHDLALQARHVLLGLRLRVAYGQQLEPSVGRAERLQLEVV